MARTAIWNYLRFTRRISQSGGGKPTFPTSEIPRPARLFQHERLSSNDYHLTAIISWLGRWACPRSFAYCPQSFLQLPLPAFSSITQDVTGSFPRSAMTISSIKRVGIVLKPHHPDALKTVCELTIWLAERGITLLGGPEIERDRITQQTGCAVEQVEPEKLSASVELILVLGGD